jgi:type I restriction-modification system DNA methylase subunit
MSALLQKLHLAPLRGRASLSGLVSVRDDLLPHDSIPEMVAKREADFLKGGKDDPCAAIDFIFFRRFNDGRSPQVAAYIVDNSRKQYADQRIAELHRRVWLNGTAPLLYVEHPTRVDILRCAAGPEFWDKRQEQPSYHAAAEISDALDGDKFNRFSAFRLATGTFWESPENANWARAKEASHKRLIDAVIEADRNLKGAAQPVMRRLLLLFIFTKYLEDRGVFPNNWFQDYSNKANSFLDVLKAGKPKAVLEMLAALKDKFNGDIFELPEIRDSLNAKILTEFTDLLEARTINRQRYLWEQYSFRYIPVEVLSHVYQHFAQAGTGAIYTPPFVADLMLDHLLPYDDITGKERVLDPTCGSGIFLVGAFRRLVYHWQNEHEWRRPGVPLLKNMLKRSIFGVEDLTEATQVAALNLALAVCDALQPNVIWNDLKFDTLIGRNLFQGDFFENLGNLKAAAPEGFSAIVGNPPYSSKLTPAAKDVRRPEWASLPIPDKNIAYQITEECADLLAEGARLCLLQPSGFLYNANPREFAARFIASHTVESVLDFVSIRNLFEAADTKALALVVRREKPAHDHEIRHLTFRKTKSVHERLGFELDHYDEHYIPQEVAETSPWIWKVNLLGGGRLANLTAKVMEWPTLEQYLANKGWSHGEGFIVGKNEERKNPCDWLRDQRFLPTEALTENGMDSTAITSVPDHRVVYPSKPERFTPPMLLILENEELPSALHCDGELTFLHSIVSINAPEHEVDDF